MRRLVWVTLLASTLVGCGGGEAGGGGSTPPPPPGGGAPKPPGAAGAPGAAGPAQPGVEQTKEALLAEVRKRQLTNDDFKETTTNRDPFRSFLTTFATQVVNVKPQHRILLEKYALEELHLIAIVGGNGETPRAMFVDPVGMGITVVRGDHVSKMDALVTRVAPDRVFFQIEEDPGNGGKPKVSERVVELHQGENLGAGQ